MQPCEQKDRIVGIDAKIDRMEQTLYRGNGKPSIMSQLEVGNEKFNEIDKKLDSIMSYGKAIVLAVIGLIGSTLWDMIQKHSADIYYTHNKTTEVAK